MEPKVTRVDLSSWDLHKLCSGWHGVEHIKNQPILTGEHSLCALTFFEDRPKESTSFVKTIFNYFHVGGFEMVWKSDWRVRPACQKHPLYDFLTQYILDALKRGSFQKSMESLVFILITALMSDGKVINKIPLEWNRELSFSPEFHLKWNNLDSKWITMEMSGPGSGYVALGFSGNGGMKGSDIVMGWVDHTGEPHLKDLHGVGNVMPVEDYESNYELLSGEERDGKTRIRFRRKWDTCDPQDFPLTDDTIRLIWAFGEQDPISNENGSFVAKYHLSDRGGRSIFLKTDPDNFPKENSNGDVLDPSIKYWDIFQNNTIKGDTTVYQCQLLKLPRLEKKHQLIGFKPIVDKKTAKYIHHMVFLECIVPHTDGINHDIFEKHLNKSTENCYPSLPPVWQKYCANFLWSIGKEGDMIPEQTGIPLGEEHNGVTYISFDIHYDNPMRHTFVDNSGIRVYYTDKLREFDGATLLMGHRISFFHVIPPQMESFKTSAFCSSECTAAGIPEGGVTITHALLHAHKTARKLTLRHIRNGIELPPLAEDKYFDVYYEQSRPLKPHRQFLPGDELLMECNYETMDRKNVTFSGSSLDDEMCIAVLYYYPKSNLLDCKSQPEFYNFLNSVQIEQVEGPGLKVMGVPFKPSSDQLYNPIDDVFMTQNAENLHTNPMDKIRIMKPLELVGKTMGDYIRSYKWNEDNGTLARAAEDQWTKGPHYMYCGSVGKTRIPLQNYVSYPPKILRKYEPPVNSECQSNCCNFESRIE